MKEFTPIINQYSLEGYSMYARNNLHSEWDNIALAESFLERYWLPLQEYEHRWNIIQDQIFTNQGDGLPQMIFKPEFAISVVQGGCLFTQDDFSRIQESLVEMGEQYLFVIENTFNGRLKEPFFRMKFPANISWDSLNSGGFVSSILLEMPHKEYFVFSESGNWGRYSASDYKIPLDIYGFKDPITSIFKERIFRHEAKKDELVRSLPEIYRIRIEQENRS